MTPELDFANPWLIRSVETALARNGQSLGRTDWFTVTQELINEFGRTTGDLQWIHVDPVRAAKGPFGSCVAHGLLTLSLAGGRFFHELVQTTASSGVNYGCDRVRYPVPVRAGSRVRGGAEIVEATKIEVNGVQLKVRVAIEVQGESRPAWVADFIVRYEF
jgi:acyl dehydratase